MNATTKRERRHLELAFESSTAIVALEGLEQTDHSRDIQQRIISGDLDFDQAVQLTLNRISALQP